MRTIEAIKIKKRAMICKCYNKSQLGLSFFFKLYKNKTDRIEKERKLVLGGLFAFVSCTNKKIKQRLEKLISIFFKE